MADLLLTAMVTPNNQTIYCTRDGTPYKGDDTSIAYVLPGHVTELTARGLTTATGSQVPAGDTLIFDMGW